MKLAVKESHRRRSSLTPHTLSTVDDLSYNISLAYAKYFRHIMGTPSSRRGTRGSLWLSGTDFDLSSGRSKHSSEDEGDPVDPISWRKKIDKRKILHACFLKQNISTRLFESCLAIVIHSMLFSDTQFRICLNNANLYNFFFLSLSFYLSHSLFLLTIGRRIVLKGNLGWALFY